MTWVYLDDQFPDHPKVVAAGGDAAWLYVCGLSYTKRHGTRGKIPKGMVGRISDRKRPDRLAAKLVEVELWVDAGDHFVIHDYDEWNKSADAKSEAGRKAAHARWGTKPPSDAEGNAVASDSHSDRTSEPPDSDDASGMPKHALSLTHPLVKEFSSSEPLLDATAGGEDPVLEAVWVELARRDAAAFTANGGVIRSKAWFTTAANNRRAEHGFRAGVLRIEHPAWTQTQLVDALTATPDDQAVQAMRALITKDRSCPDCHGAGQIELDDGAHPCPCRQTGAA